MQFEGILFSDLHLSPDTKRLNALFDAFVDAVEGTPHVACLGDLFEYWVGPKQLQTAHGRHVFESMRRLARNSESAIWVSGNRDFLCDSLMRKAGFLPQKDLYLGDFCNQPVALEHGDRFCTLDRSYQWFRWWLRKLPLNLVGTIAPASFCHAVGRRARNKSRYETRHKDPALFEIQPEPVERHIQQGAETVICGHVHTPFERSHETSGKQGRLLVMSDWQEHGAVVCAFTNGQFRLMHFDGNAFQPFETPCTQALRPPAIAASAG